MEQDGNSCGTNAWSLAVTPACIAAGVVHMVPQAAGAAPQLGASDIAEPSTAASVAPTPAGIEQLCAKLWEVGKNPSISKGARVALRKSLRNDCTGCMCDSFCAFSRKKDQSPATARATYSA
jgi:hypothetical protein